jgi:hypothetical protein
MPEPQIRKTAEPQKRKSMFPRRGTLKRSVPTRMTSKIWIKPRKK